MREQPFLQPLRIPAGWLVAYNDWFEVKPEQPDSQDRLKEDLLQLRHESCNLLVDVGWYGRGESSAFTAVVYRGAFDGELLAEFISRVPSEVVSAVESWLQEPYQLSKLKGLMG